MRSCPICSKAEDKTYAPFCSARCKDIDLGKWLTETYAITGRDGEAANDNPRDEGDF